VNARSVLHGTYGRVLGPSIAWHKGSGRMAQERWCKLKRLEVCYGGATSACLTRDASLLASSCVPLLCRVTTPSALPGTVPDALSRATTGHFAAAAAVASSNGLKHSKQSTATDQCVRQPCVPGTVKSPGQVAQPPGAPATHAFTNLNLLHYAKLRAHACNRSAAVA
jgi:hypothetical protein